MKVILTSAGFENRAIEEQFLRMVRKPVNEIKALWIPTAAVDDEAKEMLPKCMQDLLNAGIPEKHITVYDLDRTMSLEELRKYDAVYVCGGDCRHLLDKMHERNFTDILEEYVKHGVYVGVSAGSCICSQDYEDGLRWLPCYLNVHCENGSQNGKINLEKTDVIDLTNQQAIIFDDNELYILE